MTISKLSALAGIAAFSARQAAVAPLLSAGRRKSLDRGRTTCTGIFVTATRLRISIITLSASSCVSK